MSEAVRAPYGRHSVDVLGSVPDGRPVPTYYGRPALKPTEWRWLITSYLFIGGLAGAAQVISSIVDLAGHRRHRALVRAGRYLALTGAMISPLLLIADLKTPSRWYNMLRVFRRTSPMSIGSWTLLAFGASSGLAAFGQFTSDLFGFRAMRTLARSAGIPAALSGGLLATYTGSLLAATSTPLWAVAYRWLPALFGASACASATAALSLMAQCGSNDRASLRRLNLLALACSLIELVLTRTVDRQLEDDDVRAPLEQPTLRVAHQFGAVGLGIVVPLVLYLLQALTGREIRAVSVIASIAALVGGYSQRAVLLMGGKDSAEHARDYFQIAQPYRIRDLADRA